MCATRMSDGEPGEDFIRLSTVLGGDEGRTFNTLLISVRLHCHSSPYHFQRLLHNWTPETGQESVLQLMTSYLKIMEKAMGSPFILRNATEQFKQFFQKVPQTLPQTFSLACGLSKEVETQVDFRVQSGCFHVYSGVSGSHSPSACAVGWFPLLSPTTTREKKSGACNQNIKLTAGVESSPVC